jgi:hypothetical protein
MRRLILLALVAFQLTGCSSFRHSTEASVAAPILLAELPEQARSCQGPAPIVIDPEAAFVSADDLYKGWGRDRKRLAVCKRVNDSLLIYFDTLKAGFEPKK